MEGPRGGEENRRIPFWRLAVRSTARRLTVPPRHYMGVSHTNPMRNRLEQSQKLIT